MSRSRGARVLRGALAASLATLVALLSHVAGGGDVPGWLGIAVPWVLAVAVCTVLVGRSLSFLRLSIGVVLSQILFHTLFVLGMFDGAVDGPVGQVHVHHLAAGAGEMTQMHADALMWGWHVVGALATAAVLYRGEYLVRGLLALAGEIVHAVRRRLVVTMPVIVAKRPTVRPDVLHRVITPLGWHGDSVARRGPPSFSVI